MRRNLISVSLLIKLGCSLLLDSSGIKISRHSLPFGSGVIMNDYLKLNCSVFKNEVMLIENNDTNSTNTSLVLKEPILTRNQQAYGIGD